MKIAKHLILIALAVLSLTSCSNGSSMSSQATGDYNASDVGKVNKVATGVIISGRTVNVYSKPSKNSSDLDADVTKKIGYEYVIKLDSSAIVSVVQTENLHLQPKQHILVIYGKSTRVVADEGYEG